MTRKADPERTSARNYPGEIEVWQNAFSDWEKAVAELEQITFGALNSLGSLIHPPCHPDPSIAAFHDVAIESFRWTHGIQDPGQGSRGRDPIQAETTDAVHQFRQNKIHPNVLAETLEDTQTRDDPMAGRFEQVIRHVVLTGQIHPENPTATWTS